MNRAYVSYPTDREPPHDDGRMSAAGEAFSEANANRSRLPASTATVVLRASPGAPRIARQRMLRTPLGHTVFSVE